MKKLCIAYMALSTLFACHQAPDVLVTEIKENSTGFDSATAQRFGADELGMKKYVMAFLKAGPNRNQDSATAAQLQAAHMANIGRMAEAGKLVLAGPFFGDGELRGIYLFNVASIDEARALTNTDPAIEAGSLVMDLQEWYGSAAIMAVDSIHRRIARKTF